MNKTLNKLAIYNESIYLSVYQDRAYNLLFRTVPEPPAFLMVEEFLGDSRSVFESIFQSTIKDIYTIHYDRIGIIIVEKRKSSGKVTSYKLIFEITGGYSNFFIIDEDEKILFSLSKKSIDPNRNINLGSKYTLPRANKRYSLDNFIGAENCNELTGFYPLTAKYADSILCEHKSKEDGFNDIRSRLVEDEFFYVDKSDKIIPFRIDNFSRKVSVTELNEFYKERRFTTGNDKSLKLEISNIYSSLLNKKVGILEKLNNELADANNYRRYYDEATLLKSNLYKISGAGEYELDNYSDTGEISKINYHIKLNENPIKIIDKLFNRATKLKRSITLIKNRIDVISNEIFGIEEAIYLLADCNDIEELKRIKADLKVKDNQKNIKAKRKDEVPFYTFKLDGFTLLLGRNSLSNHRLITNYAIDSDIWFHARLVPSAHLLLRLDGGVELTKDMVETASKLVASFSKRKNDSKVDIDYTLRKYIKKVAGASLGFVTYSNFKTITVEPYQKDELKLRFGLLS